MQKMIGFKSRPEYLKLLSHLEAIVRAYPMSNLYLLQGNRIFIQYCL